MIKSSFLLLASLILLWSCSKPTPEDMVRKYRREYAITFDFVVSSSDDVSIEVEVQNKSGGKNLQDLTVIIKGFDENDAVIWERTEVLDVTGIGNYASEKFSFKENLPEASQNLQALDVSIAPDQPGSGFENYREFMRIGN